MSTVIPAWAISTKIVSLILAILFENKLNYKLLIEIDQKSVIHSEKQPPRGVLKKRCSENMQQTYRRTPMPKCDFNKVASIKLQSKITFLRVC